RAAAVGCISPVAMVRSTQREQALELPPCRGSGRKDASRIQEQLASAIAWCSFRHAKRIARKLEATAPSHVRPGPKLAADHSATYSSTCNYDFHRSGLRRMSAAKERSSKQDQYRKEGFQVAASTLWQTGFARQTGWIGEVKW